MSAEISDVLLEIAEKELNETPDRRVSALSTFRKVISTWPPEEVTFVADDNFLLSFLRPCKFDVEKAARKLKAMLKFRQEHIHELQNLNGEALRSFYEQGCFQYLNVKSKDGATIAALLPGRLTKTDDLVKWNIWTMDRLQFDPQVQVCGFIIIVNNGDFTLSKIFELQRNIHHIMDSKKFFLNCAPYRLKGIYILNAPVYMSWVWTLLKLFLSKKMKDRIYMLGTDLKPLHEVVDPAHLPPEFGGTLVEPAGQSWFEQQVQLEKLSQPLLPPVVLQPPQEMPVVTAREPEPVALPGPAEVEMTQTGPDMAAAGVAAGVAVGAAAAAIALTATPAVQSMSAQAEEPEATSAASAAADPAAGSRALPAQAAHSEDHQGAEPGVESAGTGVQDASSVDASAQPAAMPAATAAPGGDAAGVSAVIPLDAEPATAAELVYELEEPAADSSNADAAAPTSNVDPVSAAAEDEPATVVDLADDQDQPTTAIDMDEPTTTIDLADDVVEVDLDSAAADVGGSAADSLMTHVDLVDDHAGNHPANAADDDVADEPTSAVDLVDLSNVRLEPTGGEPVAADAAASAATAAQPQAEPDAAPGFSTVELSDAGAETVELLDEPAPASTAAAPQPPVAESEAAGGFANVDLANGDVDTVDLLDEPAPASNATTAHPPLESEAAGGFANVELTHGDVETVDLLDEPAAQPPLTQSEAAGGLTNVQLTAGDVETVDLLDEQGNSATAEAPGVAATAATTSGLPGDDEKVPDDNQEVIDLSADAELSSGSAVVEVVDVGGAPKGGKAAPAVPDGSHAHVSDLVEDQ